MVDGPTKAVARKGKGVQGLHVLATVTTPLNERATPPTICEGVVPTDLTIWDWLFDSSYSPLAKEGPIAGYTNAITGERIDYAQVKQYTTFVSTVLTKEYGLREGDTVALFSPNTIWYPVALLGVLRAGGIVSGASPAYNVDEMTYALKKAKAKFLMTVPSSMGVATAAAQSAGIPRSRIFLLEGRVDGYTTLKDLLATGKALGHQQQLSSYKLPRGKKNKDVCALLSFSSGTTGLPKAVRNTTASIELSNLIELRS
ncbi:MAG: hypothetical protein Q9174_002587 [Haloplaca sp. 1 TL-2023]